MQKAQRSPQPDYKDGGGGGNSGDDPGGRRRELLRYAGLSTEVVASVGLSVFLGVKADKWLKVSFPIFSWLLPLLVIVALLINLIKAGSGKKNGK
jgi:Putative F0F1-ATPase subunit Ca2+/Mg2+ transporter